MKVMMIPQALILIPRALNQRIELLLIQHIQLQLLRQSLQQTKGNQNQIVHCGTNHLTDHLSQQGESTKPMIVIRLVMMNRVEMIGKNERESIRMIPMAVLMTIRRDHPHLQKIVIVARSTRRIRKAARRAKSTRKTRKDAIRNRIKMVENNVISVVSVNTAIPHCTFPSNYSEVKIQYCSINSALLGLQIPFFKLHISTK
jgi:hypothetical protein